jgi:tetratricopeptide (TPR) repeat protein
MPGHIWLVLGDWETAVSVNERAVAVDREYFRLSKVEGGTYEPYYLHNLHFIVYARSMQGRKAQTLQAANELASESGAMMTSMPEMVDAFAAVPAFMYVRFNAWDKVLSLPQPADKMPAMSVSWHYARALALKAKGDAAGAKTEQDRFEEIRSKVPADAGWGQSKARDVFAVASEALAAHMAPDLNEACIHWQRAVETQDRLTYDEPPDWYYPVRESQGACLLRAGKADEAAKVFREGVRRSPRNGRMLFGLWQSLKAQRRTGEAESVKREFDAAWAGSDVVLRLEDL